MIALPSATFHSLARACRSTGFPEHYRTDLVHDRKAIEFYWSGLKGRLHSHRYALWTVRVTGTWFFLQDGSEGLGSLTRTVLSNAYGAAHVYRVDLRTGKVKCYGFGEKGADAYKADNPRWREGLAGK